MKAIVTMYVTLLFKQIIICIVGDFGGFIIPWLCGSLLRKISNYAARFDATLSALILLKYMKMMSTSVQ